MKILIVEDNSDLCTLLEVVLREKGHTVYGITDPTLVFPTLEKEKFDLLFLDEHLAGVRGSEMLPIIKKQWSELPVVIMSGDPREILEETLKQGASAVLPKPFPLTQLYELVDQFTLPSYNI